MNIMIQKSVAQKNNASTNFHQADTYLQTAEKNYRQDSGKY